MLTATAKEPTMPASTNPLDYHCRRCGSLAGSPCVSDRGPRTPHLDRVRRAASAERAARKASPFYQEVGESKPASFTVTPATRTVELHGHTAQGASMLLLSSDVAELWATLHDGTKVKLNLNNLLGI